MNFNTNRRFKLLTILPLEKSSHTIAKALKKFQFEVHHFAGIAKSYSYALWEVLDQWPLSLILMAP